MTIKQTQGDYNGTRRPGGNWPFPEGENWRGEILRPLDGYFRSKDFSGDVGSMCAEESEMYRKQ